MNEATEILCSENPQGDRLMTMLWVHPKFNHQEVLRHRKIYVEDNLALTFDPDFSFSVSSARAIPFRKMLEEVRSDELRAAPVWWGTEQRGMSPGDEIDDTVADVYWPDVMARISDRATPSEFVTRRECMKRLWTVGAQYAGLIAETAVEFAQPHKSIVNRQIETYVHVRCLATGTTAGWLNFFGLRLDKAADPTLRALAEAAWRVWNESRPRKLAPGEWHLPFIDQELAGIKVINDEHGSGVVTNSPRVLLKASVARCARLSYLSFETGRRSTIEEDLALYARLVGSIPLHASPAEHQATPDEWLPNYNFGEGCWLRPELAGNLGPGWVQFRKTLPGEAVAPLPEAYR